MFIFIQNISNKKIVLVKKKKKWCLSSFNKIGKILIHHNTWKIDTGFGGYFLKVSKRLKEKKAKHTMLSESVNIFSI